MRKITKETIEAFYSCKSFKKSNTQVKINFENDEISIILFGNKIAYKDTYGDLYVSICNRNTRTTRERLNGLENVHVTIKKGELRLNGNKWDGKLININEL